MGAAATGGLVACVLAASLGASAPGLGASAPGLGASAPGLGASAPGLGALLPAFLTDGFDELIRVAADTCEALPLDVLFSGEHAAEVARLPVVEHSRAGRRSYRAERAPLLLPPARELVLYVPGWWNTPTDDSSQAIVSSLLDKHSLVLLLDTRLSFCRGYVASASRVRPISLLLFQLIKNLNNRGIPLSSMHIIGFSLGAHVAGMTGKLVRRGLDGKLGKITALDPAKPCFARSKFRLERDDAKFVQVVHSSAGVLGLEEPVGHVDVYVNGISVKQPECRDRSFSLECDHAQAWKLYSASVRDRDALTGRRCANWSELMGGQCSGGEAVLGYGCSAAERGLFLYRSQVAQKRTGIQVFNPFDFRTWLRT